jgi:hypothetical protein
MVTTWLRSCSHSRAGLDPAEVVAAVGIELAVEVVFGAAHQVVGVVAQRHRPHGGEARVAPGDQPHAGEAVRGRAHHDPVVFLEQRSVASRDRDTGLGDVVEEEGHQHIAQRTVELGHLEYQLGVVALAQAGVADADLEIGGIFGRDELDGPQGRGHGPIGGLSIHPTVCRARITACVFRRRRRVGRHRIAALLLVHLGRNAANLEALVLGGGDRAHEAAAAGVGGDAGLDDGRAARNAEHPIHGPATHEGHRVALGCLLEGHRPGDPSGEGGVEARHEGHHLGRVGVARRLHQRHLGPVADLHAGGPGIGAADGDRRRAVGAHGELGLGGHRQGGTTLAAATNPQGRSTGVARGGVVFTAEAEYQGAEPWISGRTFMQPPGERVDAIRLPMPASGCQRARCGAVCAGGRGKCPIPFGF